MDIKKIGITGVIGFVSTAVMGGINTALYYQKHMTGVADKFPRKFISYSCHMFLIIQCSINATHYSS